MFHPKFLFMNYAYQIKRWSSTHPVLLTILRIILGICLTARGLYFLNNNYALNQMITNSALNSLDMTAILAMLITAVHILGGAFIILGLFTKLSTWAQVPIVVGAIIFINLNGGVHINDLLFSIFILLLLSIFIIEGGGNISMDHHIKRTLL